MHNLACRNSPPIDFIVDTGASVSILPIDSVGNLSLSESPVRLSGADGSSIEVVGETTFNFHINNLNKVFRWTFVVAHTQSALLGIDFLKYYGLAIDCKRNAVIDPTTNTSTGKPVYDRVNRVSIDYGQDSRVSALLKTYPSVITPRTPKELDNSSVVQHCIDTGEAVPVYCKTRRLDAEKEAFAKAQFQNLINDGIIRPSKSPWSSALLLVPKPPDTWRICGDYRNLNRATKPDRYPVPNMHSVTNRLQGKKVFSRIDLVKAYHQIPMRPTDIEKTAISTPFGLYEYLFCPFGLKNAGATFQRHMDHIFQGIENIFIYFDDILIFSEDEESHKVDVENVLRVLDRNCLKISLEKSIFFQSSVDFLGYEINAEGVRPTKAKKEHLLNYPEPNHSKALRSFLGLINFYRRLIPNFANKVMPLTELMKNNQKPRAITFNTLEKKAFREIKEELANKACLLHPSTQATRFQLVTDASSHAVGAALHQMIDDKPIPIGFFSKKLSEAQRRYSTYDRELLAVYLSVLHFKPLISDRLVTVFTDHNSQAPGYRFR